MSIPIKLIIAALLGAAIGLEREAYERKVDKTRRSGIGSLGIRSFSLISLVGSIAGLSLNGFTPLFNIISLAFVALLTIYYVLGSRQTKDIGMTTELAILICYVIGVLIGLDFFPIQVTVALTVVLILILSLKEEIKSFISNIKEYEIDAFLSYAIIALVILPFLPDVSYTIADILGMGAFLGEKLKSLSTIELLNPFNLWRVVAIITGIEVVGYFLEKTIGQKGGWFLTAFAGGFISSTSTTQSLAIKSKKTKTTHRLVSAALLSNIASFLQHFLLIASINIVLLLNASAMIGALVFSGIIVVLFFIRKKDKVSKKQLLDTRKRLDKDTIFSLKPALQFAVLFLVIKFLSKASLVLFGSSAFFVTVIFSSLAGIDAISINIAELAGKSIQYSTAVLALMLAHTANLLAKSVYSFILGSRTFAWYFLISMLIIISAGFAALIPFLI
ncbi:MAG: DUF4010 domain-containing protein [Patescibacteria group bacterium]